MRALIGEWLPPSIFSPPRTAAVRPPQRVRTKQLRHDLSVPAVQLRTDMELLDRDSISLVLTAAAAADKFTLGAARVCSTWRELLREPRLLQLLRDKGVVLGIGIRLPIMPVLSHSEQETVDGCVHCTGCALAAIARLKNACVLAVVCAGGVRIMSGSSNCPSACRRRQLSLACGTWCWGLTRRISRVSWACPTTAG